MRQYLFGNRALRLALVKQISSGTACIKLCCSRKPLKLTQQISFTVSVRTH